MFKGSIPALITPFRNGKLDERAFQSLVEWHAEQGTDGVVPCGTTGECATLDPEEHRRVIELCVEAAGRRLPVMAGTGTNSTEKTIALTRQAKKASADAALVVTPYYNKPTQEGLFRHFKAVHDAVDIPIYVYNIPGRAAVEVSVETMARLAKLPHIAGVKDATADISRPLKERAAIASDFCFLSGDDATAVAYLAAGGHGCISVTANVAPKLSAEMHRAWREGDLGKARAIQDRLLPLHVGLFCETNPAPVKYALSLLGRSSPELRLPLVELGQASKETVQRAMAAVGLLVEKAA